MLKGPPRQVHKVIVRQIDGLDVESLEVVAGQGLEFETRQVNLPCVVCDCLDLEFVEPVEAGALEAATARDADAEVADRHLGSERLVWIGRKDGVF